MKSQDSVVLQTAEKQMGREPETKNKTIGTTDSHFVLICWPIMMKNEQGNRKEGH